MRLNTSTVTTTVTLSHEVSPGLLTSNKDSLTPLTTTSSGQPAHRVIVVVSLPIPTVCKNVSGSQIDVYMYIYKFTSINSSYMVHTFIYTLMDAFIMVYTWVDAFIIVYTWVDSFIIVYTWVDSFIIVYTLIDSALRTTYNSIFMPQVCSCVYTRSMLCSS